MATTKTLQLICIASPFATKKEANEFNMETICAVAKSRVDYKTPSS